MKKYRVVQALNAHRLIIFVLLTGVIFNSSCAHYSCNTYGIRGLQINSSSTIADTNAAVSRYTQDGTFTNLVEAYSVSVFGADDMKFLNFPVSGKDAWNYDWMVVLRPSGKTYKLRQFKAEGDESVVHCVNPIHYLVNDSAMVAHGATQANMDTATMYLLVYY